MDPAEVKFSPETAVAFRRSVLGFPGLCAISSCCVGEQCSDFLTMTGPTVSCYIPLLELGDESGIYNVSVIFPNGTRAFAKYPLIVSRPVDRVDAYLPEVRRYASPPNRISGVFFNWTREVSLIVPCLGPKCFSTVVQGPPQVDQLKSNLSRPTVRLDCNAFKCFQYVSMEGWKSFGVQCHPSHYTIRRIPCQKFFQRVTDIREIKARHVGY